MRVALLSLVLAAILAALLHQIRLTQHEGCRTYVPIKDKILVAHAGGGLPDKIYANTFDAMDVAVRHRFRYLEIDFWKVGDEILLAHDKPLGSEPTAAQLLAWMQRHPEVFVVTDFKTDNEQGLRQLSDMAGPLRTRFIPQIYNPSEFKSVSQLGMRKPILTLYRVKEPWREFANSADIAAVTMFEAARENAKGINKPIFLHTVNRPVDHDVAGYYTDCLVPA